MDGDCKLPLILRRLYLPMMANSVTGLRSGYDASPAIDDFPPPRRQCPPVCGTRIVNAADIEVCRLAADDAQLFRDIRLEALRLAPDAFASTFEAESARPLSAFAERLGGAHVLGAFRAERLVGVATLSILQNAKMAHKGHLVGMYVRPEARRSGVGRRLVEAVIETARRHVEVIQLTVVVGNETARRLYASLGFEEYGVEKKALKSSDRYFDEILMAMDFGSARMRLE
jgi:ribosomal protein S18 acetylase RimI-like enzyme